MDKKAVQLLTAATVAILATSLTAWGQPVITVQPQSQTNFQGATITLFVTATGTPPLSYQWSRNGIAVTNATNAMLVLVSLQASNQGNYIVVITNIEGMVMSAVASVRLLTRPTITTQPVSKTVETGATTSFSVTASGTAPLSYQWLFNRTPLPNGTNSTLVLSNIQLAHAGDYTLVVTNNAGATTSQVARLTVVPPAPFTRITTGAVVTDGADGEGCAWVDFDNDGDLDLYVSCDNTGANLLYRNDSNGAFTRITTGPIVTDGGRSISASWADMDNDGHLDLFVSKQSGRGLLFRQGTDGTFTRSALSAGGFSWGSSWGDYDNDGL